MKANLLRVLYPVMFSLPLIASSTTALGQSDFPSKPVTLLVGYAGGGVSDIQARVLADLLGKELKQKVLVENKPGMSAAVMLNYLIRQPADGYTLATTPAGALFGNPYML